MLRKVNNVLQVFRLSRHPHRVGERKQRKDCELNYLLTTSLVYFDLFLHLDSLPLTIYFAYSVRFY